MAGMFEERVRLDPDESGAFVWADYDGIGAALPIRADVGSDDPSVLIGSGGRI